MQIGGVRETDLRCDETAPRESALVNILNLCVESETDVVRSKDSFRRTFPVFREYSVCRLDH